ncbi:MAG TPA: hypothetical protein VJT31_31030 [Rugosimonospora sp.]|nr:hypothetical protein [Rugosimonospora sp.]
MVASLRALLAGAALLPVLAACGARGTPVLAPRVPVSASASVPVRCPTLVVVTETANGTSVCVARSSELTVLLQDAGWSSPRVTGAALGAAEPVPSPSGHVGWMFRADTAGTADITLSRACPAPSGGAARCHSILLYRLHVRVS